MDFSEWRKQDGRSCAAIATALSLDGERDGATVWNWETGRSRPDADMVERIVALTGGAVTAEDMHAVRLAWLKANRPEKFEGEGATPHSALRATPPASQREITTVEAAE